MILFYAIWNEHSINERRARPLIVITRTPSRLSAGARIVPLEIETVSGARIAVPSRTGVTHLQFRRFAGCPVCTLHLRSFVRRQPALHAAGIEEVVFFHATREALMQYHDDVPFHLVADPSRRFYRQFRVERAARAVLNPKTWPAILRGALATRRIVLPEFEPAALGLPADFLIAPTGRILACKYGRHADDQWSVEEVLALAARAAAVAADFKPTI